MTPIKNPKYFESAEGISFLESVTDKNPPTASSQQFDPVSLASLPQSQAPSNTIFSTQTDQSFSTATPLNSVDSHIGTGVIDEIPEVVEKVTDVIPEHLVEKDTKKQTHFEKPKTRILKLPSSILGQKPGLEPNTKHIKQEQGTRKGISTSSRTLSGFIVLPSSCKFESFDKQEMFLELTNVGMESARFNIRQPEDKRFKVSYKHGAVAPGMSKKIAIEFEGGEGGLNDEFRIVSETEILHIPIVVSVKSGQIQ
jgi:hypothetical protein